MEIQAAVFGTNEHISTAFTELERATLLLELNAIPQAVALLEHAHGVFERQMGSEHPTTRRVERLLKEMEKR